LPLASFTPTHYPIPTATIRYHTIPRWQKGRRAGRGRRTCRRRKAARTPPCSGREATSEPETLSPNNNSAERDVTPATEHKHSTLHLWLAHTRSRKEAGGICRCHPSTDRDTCARCSRRRLYRLIPSASSGKKRPSHCHSEPEARRQTSAELRKRATYASLPLLVLPLYHTSPNLPYRCHAYLGGGNRIAAYKHTSLRLTWHYNLSILFSAASSIQHSSSFMTWQHVLHCIWRNLFC